MLPSSELDFYRSYISDNLMPGTAVIYRNRNGSVNDYYEAVEGTVANGTVVCRLDPYNKQDSSHMVGERDASRVWFRLSLPYDTDVQSDDTIIVGGNTYSIIQLHEGHSDNFAVRLVVAKVE